MSEREKTVPVASVSSFSPCICLAVSSERIFSAITSSVFATSAVAAAELDVAVGCGGGVVIVGVTATDRVDEFAMGSCVVVAGATGG